MRSPLPLLILAGLVAAASCGGSDSTEPANTNPEVTMVGLSWQQNPTPCQSNTTMIFTVQVLQAKIGDQVVVNFTGPGLPTTTSTTLTTIPQTISANYPIVKVAAGSSASWTALVSTVGGVRPDSVPGGHTSAGSSVSC
jgi:hypothetical protein